MRTHDKQDLNSQDHGMVLKWSFAPLVQLNISEPTNNNLGSMCQGKERTWIKDYSAQLSDIFRHAADLINKNKGTCVWSFCAHLA